MNNSIPRAKIEELKEHLTNLQIVEDLMKYSKQGRDRL